MKKQYTDRLCFHICL